MRSNPTNKTSIPSLLTSWSMQLGGTSTSEVNRIWPDDETALTCGVDAGRQDCAATCLVASPSAAADGTWTHHCKIDEMTDVKSCWATSPAVTMPDMFGIMSRRSSVGYGCKPEKEWYYVFFEGLNLTGGTIEEGYSVHYIPVRFDDARSDTAHVTVKWGSDFLHFQDGKGGYSGKILRNIRAGSTMLVRLDLYGDGQQTVRFSLAGSSAAIDRARAECGLTSERLRTLGLASRNREFEQYKVALFSALYNSDELSALYNSDERALRSIIYGIDPVSFYDADRLFQGASSSVVSADGNDTLRIVARVLDRIAKTIPADLGQWVLEIAVYTAKSDRPSLAYERSAAVVGFLLSQGILPSHLVDSGGTVTPSAYTRGLCSKYEILACADERIQLTLSLLDQ